MAGSESIRVTRSVSIPLAEIELRTSRSSGPGGQHAQKSETRVEAVFDVEASAALTERQKQRVIAKAGPVLRAVAQDERSQLRNKELAIERLVEALREALRGRGAGKPTKPTAAAKERRLEQKKRRGERSGSGGRRQTSQLFDGDGLGEVARLIDVQPARRLVRCAQAGDPERGSCSGTTASAACRNAGVRGT